MPNNGSKISDKLFADDTLSVYAILDGASVPDLPQALYKQHPEYVCLYRGELAPDMASVAPYLVHLQINTDFTDWIIRDGWGKHWGIFILSSADLRELRAHFRGLITVYDPTLKPLLFRYYDPRVMRTFLPTCKADELNSIFGPVASYILENEDEKEGLRFFVESGVLKRDAILLGEEN